MLRQLCRKMQLSPWLLSRMRYQVPGFLLWNVQNVFSYPATSACLAWRFQGLGGVPHGGLAVQGPRSPNLVLAVDCPGWGRGSWWTADGKCSLKWAFILPWAGFPLKGHSCWNRKENVISTSLSPIQIQPQTDRERERLARQSSHVLHEASLVTPGPVSNAQMVK